MTGVAAPGRPRIHYHTDHSWFGGCETMLVNLLTDAGLRARYGVSFSYRASERYTSELHARIGIDFPVYPLAFLEPNDLVPAVHSLPSPLNRIGRIVSRQLTTVPGLAYEVAILRRLFASIRPDIVHINNGGYPGALSARAAAIAARLAGVPHVLMVINNFAEDYGSLMRKAQYPVDRLVVRSVSRFLSGSVASATRLQQVLGLPSSQVQPLANGADLRQATESPGATRQRLGVGPGDGVIIGIVGLLEPRKGHGVLFDGLARLAGDAATPAFTLLVVGEGPLRGELEQRAAALGISSHVRFTGHQANPANVMNILDLLVLPSTGYEDFPNVVLEAMGAGKPVIASRMAGTPEQVAHGETGLLVAPGDSAGLAVAIRTLLTDGAARSRMGSAGRERFTARFTAPASAARYVALYGELLGEPVAP